jgi:glycosyltransferase involved in cell wall biosynthesis
LPEKVQVISNGLDVLKHQTMLARGRSISRASLGVSDEDFLFLNVASYDGRKGHHALVSALKRVRKDHSGVKVLCVGNIADPGYYAKLKERVAQAGFEKDFILHDYVDDVSALYPVADAFILPSLIEGWSISVMEAMFYGLPLILTDVGGNREIVEDVGNGIIIPTSYGDTLNLDYRNLAKYCMEQEPRNADAIANAMKDFIVRKSRWREAGAKGKAAVQEQYAIAKTARAYETLFFSVGESRENH